MDVSRQIAEGGVSPASRAGCAAPGSPSIGGAKRKHRRFVMDLPHDDAIFVKACPAEAAEAFRDGHVEVFAFFGGMPLPILCDETALAVAEVLGDGTRRRSRIFGAPRLAGISSAIDKAHG